MRTVSLDQLTVVGVRPAELVELAAAAGYGAISPFIGIGNTTLLPMTPLRAGQPDTVAMKQRMAQTGVVINNADGFALFADSPMNELKAGVELMAEMGAKNVVTLMFDADPNRGYDNFCTLNACAESSGIGLVLEFTPLSQIGGLADALAYVQRTGSRNVGILVDLLHLMQSGGTPADLLAVDPGLIRGAQLCDGPAMPSFEQYAYNALHERMVPGEGELPVAEFLAALPPELIFGVEVPLRSMLEQGVGHLERAQRLMQATRTVMAHADALSRAAG